MNKNLYKKRKNTDPIYPTKMVKADHFKTEGHKKVIKENWMEGRGISVPEPVKT